MPSGPTTGYNSFFTACDAGKCRVPSPAMGTTALRTAEDFLVAVILVAFGKHRTSNIEHRTSNEPGKTTFGVQRSMFDVRCSFFIAPRRGFFGSHHKPLPSGGAKLVALRAKLNRPRRRAFENVRHDAN